jgi:hypothetical protein
MPIGIPVSPEEDKAKSPLDHDHYAKTSEHLSESKSVLDTAEDCWEKEHATSLHRLSKGEHGHGPIWLVLSHHVHGHEDKESKHLVVSHKLAEKSVLLIGEQGECDHLGPQGVIEEILVGYARYQPVVHRVEAEECKFDEELSRLCGQVHGEWHQVEPEMASRVEARSLQGTDPEVLCLSSSEGTSLIYIRGVIYNESVVDPIERWQVQNNIHDEAKSH